MNLDIQSMDWASMTARRSKKAPLNQGGWNVFLSSASEFNVNSPLNNTYLAASCGNTLPGWPCDKELDALRAQWKIGRAHVCPVTNAHIVCRLLLEKKTTLPPHKIPPSS